MQLVVEALPGGVTLVKATGRLDIEGAQAIEGRLLKLAGAAPLVIDMADVGFLASMGLRVLMLCSREAARRGGRAVLAAPGRNVEKVLRESGIGELIGLYPTVEAAVADLAT